MASEPIPGPWKWYWRTDHDGHADCGIYWERREGQAISICRAPRYEKREQWEANAESIIRAPERIADLEAKLAEWERVAQDDYHTIETQALKLAEAQAALVKPHPDQERLNWLETECNGSLLVASGKLPRRKGDTLRQAIDAARAAKGEG